MKLPKFTRLLYGLGEHKTKIVAFFFLHNDRYCLKENLAEICHIKWNWIRSVKFEKVWIDFYLTFRFVVIQNFCYYGNWRNDVCSLLELLLYQPMDNQIFKNMKGVKPRRGAGNTFGVRATRLWNAVPNSFKKIECVHSFKKALNDFYASS